MAKRSRRRKSKRKSKRKSFGRKRRAGSSRRRSYNPKKRYRENLAKKEDRLRKKYSRYAGVNEYSNENPLLHVFKLAVQREPAAKHDRIVKDFKPFLKPVIRRNRKKVPYIKNMDDLYTYYLL